MAYRSQMPPPPPEPGCGGCTTPCEVGEGDPGLVFVGKLELLLARLVTQGLSRRGQRSGSVCRVMAHKYQQSAAHHMPPPPPGPACGGCATPCEVGEGDPGLVFVGKSRGSYVKTETYEYVGEGAGDFDTVMLPQPLHRSACCKWVCCILVLACLAVVALYLMWNEEMFPFTLARYDCNRGDTNSWRQAKRDYCCAEEEKGCLYDCDVGDVEAWRQAKTDYCCAEEEKGCLYDCD
eukprot:CAMPEP_0115428516 /NCGR_PEP_ID=MMETSP0271-20121206/30022_1 /TAXON_ID=71861 /ORGANISM="Scrippsiella trochoidea, Strain CCMP3099" /LENGTH=234 /DNA_ID=CAMNT_0002853621 /DNA_START=41 /DNA_END=743 /DNA_ORIENTATION=+